MPGLQKMEQVWNEIPEQTLINFKSDLQDDMKTEKKTDQVLTSLTVLFSLEKNPGLTSCLSSIWLIIKHRVHIYGEA